MKHPVIKLFLARLRAVAAADRAAYPVLALPALLAPFARHAIRVEEKRDGGFAVIAEGEAIQALFGRSVTGLAIGDLFQGEDSQRINAMLSASLSDRVACVVGAEAQHSRFRSTMLEAMLAPEPAQPGAPRRISLCLIAFGFRRRAGRRALPALKLTSSRFVDLDGLAGAPRMFQTAFRPLRRG